MKVSIKIECESVAQAHETLAKLADIKAPAAITAGPAELVKEPKPAKSPGRPVKAAPAPEAEPSMLDDMTNPEASAPADDMGLGDVPPAQPEKELVIEDVIAQLQKFVAKHGEKGRAKAAEILKKYGVKSVRDLKIADYAGVIKAAQV